MTHRLNEVFRISHRVTVLRDGVNVGTFNTAETDMKTLVAAIVGPKLAAAEARAAVEPCSPAKPERTASATPILAGGRFQRSLAWRRLLRGLQRSADSTALPD